MEGTGGASGKGLYNTNVEDSKFTVYKKDNSELVTLTEVVVTQDSG